MLNMLDSGIIEGFEQQLLIDNPNKYDFTNNNNNNLYEISHQKRTENLEKIEEIVLNLFKFKGTKRAADLQEIMQLKEGRDLLLNEFEDEVEEEEQSLNVAASIKNKHLPLKKHHSSSSSTYNKNPINPIIQLKPEERSNNLNDWNIQNMMSNYLKQLFLQTDEPKNELLKHYIGL